MAPAYSGSDTRAISGVRGSAWAPHSSSKKASALSQRQDLTHGTLLNPPPTVGISDWATSWDEDRIRVRGGYLA